MQQSRVIDRLARIEENDIELIMKKTKDEDLIKIDTLL